MNRLAQESSPYLRQHADNPVDWYPWGEEAFLRSKTENKPILLSVGYSSCHWCHVMAHESFEDAGVAELMNKWFVNVKVDREERPDVDAIYMEAVQAMTGQGGWPMTVFLTPDGRPFYAGTYFPKENYAGRPGFSELLRAIDTAWRDQADDVETSANQLRSAIAERTHAEASDLDPRTHGRDWLAHAHAALEASHDKAWGGFGQAPKFPQAAALDLLLRAGDEKLTEMVITSLDAMASGGMYDQIGGGFSRYSVDSFWMVPHFEKMLYDQAGLVRTYLHAYQVSGDARYRQIVEETVEYVCRDLAAPHGGWYCAEDADSEGEEGKFYVWRPEEIDAAIDDAEIADAVKQFYGVTKSGNFEGSNILHRPERGQWTRNDQLEEGRRRLMAARAKRVRPGLDDKVLTEWVAMFASTLAEAGAALNRADWIDGAGKACTFLLGNLRRQDGRWLRAWHRSGGSKQLAYANDYAWLIEAFLRLAEATGEARWRSEARQVANAMIELFWDHDQGGLFTTGHDAEKLIVRSKDLFDGATPCANSTAAVALVRLGAMTGEQRYTDHAERILALVANPISHHPTAFTYYLAAVDLLAGDVTEAVIAGHHPKLVQWAQSQFLPRNVLVWGEPDDSPLWEGRTDGAYVCRGETCGPVAKSTEELAAQLTQA